MIRQLNITEARKHLLDLPGELEDEPIIITRRGKPVMAALSYEQFEALLETLEILSDPEASLLEKSLDQAERGETLSLQEAKARLGI